MTNIYEQFLEDEPAAKRSSVPRISEGRADIPPGMAAGTMQAEDFPDVPFQIPEGFDFDARLNELSAASRRQLAETQPENDTTLRETAGQVLPMMKESVMAPFAVTGEFANAATQDLVRAGVRALQPDWQGDLPDESDLAVLTQNYLQPASAPKAELPYAQTLREISKSNPIAATTGKFAAGTVGMAPMMAAGMPAGLTGKLVSAMFAADMAAGAGTGAGKIAGEFDKPEAQRDWDVITSGAADVGMGAFAPFAAKHAAFEKAAPRNMAAAIENMTPESRQRYVDSLGNQKSTKMTDPEMEELFQLRIDRDQGKLNADDASRLEHLENKDKGLGHRLSAEEENYIKQEREAIDNEHAIEVSNDIEEGSPFSGQVATINRRTNKIMINPAELSLALRDIPKAKRAAYVKSLIAEESIHLKTTDAQALDYWNSLTWGEKRAVERRYTGEWSGRAPGMKGVLSETELGHEALRAQIQKLQGMEPTEIAQQIGTGRLKSKAVNAAENALLGIRKLLRTKASKAQADIIDAVTSKISKAGEPRISEGETPGSVRQGGDEGGGREVSDSTRRFLEAVADPTRKIHNFTEGVSTAEVGLGARSISDLDALLEARKSVKSEMDALSASAKQKMQAGDMVGAQQDFSKAGAIATKAQLAREAIETAVDYGSGSEAMAGKKKLGERPLNWQKNPEVEQWLRANAKDAGINFEEGEVGSRRQGKPSFIEQQKAKLEELRYRMKQGDQSLTPAGEAMAAKHEAMYEPPTPKSISEIGEQTLSAERPTFADFVARARTKHGHQLEEGQLHEAWQDAVWNHLKNASGAELSRLRDELKLRRQVHGTGVELQKQTKTGRVPEIREGQVKPWLGEKPIPDAPPVEPESVAHHQEIMDRGGRMIELADKIERSLPKVRGSMDESSWLMAQGKRQRAQMLRRTGTEMQHMARNRELPMPERDLFGEANKPTKQTKVAPLTNWAEKTRARAMSVIAQKLIMEMAPRKALNRGDLSLDDIRWSQGDKAWVEIDKHDINSPVTLGHLLTADARTNATTQEVVAGGRKKQGRDALPESATKRVTVLRDKKTGEVHVVSTYKSGRRGPVLLDPRSIAKEHRPVGQLLERYEPMYSVLLDNPVKDFHKTYKSVQDFNSEIGNEGNARAEQAGWSAEATVGPEQFEAEGNPDLQGEGGFVLGPNASAVRASLGMGKGALEIGANITPAEASAAFSAFRWMENAADANDLISDLATRARKSELKPKDWLLISAMQKVNNAMTELFRGKSDLKGKELGLNRAEMLDITDEQIKEATLNELYNLAKDAAERENFISIAKKKYAQEPEIPAGPEAKERGAVAVPPAGRPVGATATGARELSMLSRRAPTSVLPENLPPGYEAPAKASAPKAELGATEPVRTPYKPRAGRERLPFGERSKAVEIPEGDWVRDVEKLHDITNPKKLADQLAEDDIRPGSIRQRATKIVRDIPEVMDGFMSGYDSHMVDRIEKNGGPVSAEFAEAVRAMIDRQKKFYGDLTPSLDKAKELAGGNSSTWFGQRPNLERMKAVNWANKLEIIKGAPFAAVSRVVGLIEGTLKNVPMWVRELQDAARQANLEIGQMAAMASPGFMPGGLFARNLTGLGYDIVRAGRGDMWNKWTAALARSNNLPITKVRTFMREWKKVLDAPDVNADVVNKIKQDFSRKYKNVVTHIKDANGQWQQIVHADLFNYLENAAQIATHARAFRQVWPNTPTGNADLASAMSDIRAELADDRYKKDLNSLMLTLQGHPTDNYSSMGMLAPGTHGGQALRLFNQTIGNAMSKMALTGQLFVQPGEVIAGSTPVFLGYKNYIRGMARLNELKPQLEQMGAINRMIYDFSLDRNSPVRSAFKSGGNVLSKVFVEQALNELQEQGAAATAFVVSERIKNGTLSPWEKRMLPETFKAMKFNSDQIMGLMQGDQALLDQFIRKSASFLTSGNRSISEGSRLSSNRLFNSVFRFQAYPMMKNNQFRRVAVNMAEAWRDGTPREKRNTTEMMARFMFGNTLQGALTVGITALAYQGTMGAKIKAKEAADEPLKFLTESFLSTVSGPLYMAWRGWRSKGVTGIGENATRAAFPYTVVSELTSMAQGTGRYKDLDTSQRIGEFLKAKVPGTKAITTGLAMAGLAQADQKLDASIEAFFRWRRDEQGWIKRDGMLVDDERAELRKEMRAAVEAMKSGDQEAFNKHYSNAISASTQKDSVKSSFAGRKVLKSITGADLTPEQMESLVNRIGQDAVDRLEYFDLMLDAAGQGALMSKYDE